MTRRSPYRSYGYLRPGRDYQAFELAPEVGRVPAYNGRLDREQAERARRIVADSVVVSLHDHPSVYPLRIEEVREYNRAGRQATGFEDIQRAHDTQRLALIAGLEAATMIENELDRIDILYGFGVRQMGIAYSEANTLGSGLKEKGDGGLTAFGERAVERMNRIGMAIDISHSGDRTCLDVIEASTRPVLITHAGSRTVWDSPRMKPDEVIVACARKGGVIGIEAAPHTTLSVQHSAHSLESVMDHFSHCVELVGVDHVAFGPDTLFGDHVGLHRVFATQLSVGEIRGSARFEEVDYVDGLENPGECFHNIAGWLVKNDWADDDIRKVIGGNALRVLGEIW